MNIRLVDFNKDFEMLQSWSWESMGKELGRVLTRDMTTDTSFIIEKDGKPVASACLFLTNCKTGCIVENVLSDMTVDKEIKREAVSTLFKFLENEAKNMGYTMLLLLAYHPKVIERYKELGFTETMTNFSSLAKEIK